MKFCPSGKQMLDKKGAVSQKNLIWDLHHIQMKIYECFDCKYWHLATVDKKEKHNKFSHRGGRLDKKKYGFVKYSHKNILTLDS